MAATVKIVRLTSSGPTETDVTSVSTRASTSDNPYTTETTNPVPIPAAGSNRTFWVVTRLKVTVTPSGTIDNLKWYTDGTNGSGTGITTEAGTSASYDQATGTVGTTGDQLNSTNYTGLSPTSPSADNAFGYTSAASLSVTGTISSPTTGQFGSYVAYQYTVGTGAGAGTASSETFTWQYDET